MKELIAAIYCRLSKEDLDKDLEKSESESIKNQKMMLESYALEHNWKIHDFYIDEDYSGSDRDRPEFSRMITDAMLGRFNIVLCKKQARFARDIEYIEKYVHGLFAERRIRFVAVLDNIDTGFPNRSVKKASQINSLVDEWYLSDLSENIIAALDTKRKNAEFIGSWAPFGYRKDPENKNDLIIDPEAAAIVTEIFNLYLSGYGISRIAQFLNQKGLPNPLTYKQLHMEKINPNPERATRKRHLWTPSTVSAILHNQTYTGAMVQGKYKKASYKSKRLIRLPTSDWIIVPDSHPPIIDTETWQKVQKKLSDGSRTRGRKPQHPLAGKVFCGECGSKLVRSGGKSGNQRVVYLCCSAHNLSHDFCPGARIETSRLERLILDELNALADQFFDEEYLIERLPKDIRKSLSLSEKDDISLRLSQLEEYKRSLARKLEILYADRLDGIVDQELFILFQKKLSEELSTVEDEERSLKELADGKLASREPDARRLAAYRTMNVLTQEVAGEFLEAIYIFKRVKGEPQKIEIHWDF